MKKRNKKEVWKVITMDKVINIKLKHALSVKLELGEVWAFYVYYTNKKQNQIKKVLRTNWENIPKKVITGGKKELKAVCEKHGVLAKSLLSRKSQSRGYEMRI